MTRVIAITGKGGTGKTAITTLLIKYLQNSNNTTLAVDADPDTNLPETLGSEDERTVGDVREFMLNERDNLPPDSNKESILESKLFEVINEMSGYDLLVMGRPEGPGCYCYINNLLRGILDRLIENYDLAILDTAAGLEHFSRKLIHDIDDLIVVTDGSRRGLRTAERIRDLVDELETKVSNVYVIANKVNESNKETLEKTAKELGLELIGTVPQDEEIAERDLTGSPLFEISDNSAAFNEMKKIAARLKI
ncbi:ATP-binding protein [Methanosalsum natronophilum]|uniref:ATP-binding protein n=1 Tax=Methanosalsum natronophilum TaxID=768733 RepID=A0A424YPT9_9EURY|nr:MAG: ATP-binding protein [Methanosalsum natronophilum]